MFSLGIIPILGRAFNPVPWAVLILLSNIPSSAWFFGYRHKNRFFAFGLLEGSFAGCASYLIYLVSEFQEAVATAPQPG